MLSCWFLDSHGFAIPHARMKEGNNLLPTKPTTAKVRCTAAIILESMLCSHREPSPNQGGEQGGRFFYVHDGTYECKLNCHKHLIYVRVFAICGFYFLRITIFATNESYAKERTWRYINNTYSAIHCSLSSINLNPDRICEQTRTAPYYNSMRSHCSHRKSQFRLSFSKEHHIIPNCHNLDSRPMFH
jgi:hypothetical protein